VFVDRKEENRKRKTYRSDYVQSLFDSISHSYDFLNHLLSFGIDRYWRKKAIQTLGNFHPASILDVGAGTGDFALEALKLDPEKIIGIDISEKMLDLFKEKIKRRKLEGLIKTRICTAEKICFPDGSFDLVISSFGVRNFENLESALGEFGRVLSNSGKALILEFSMPKGYIFRSFYRFYSYYVLPFIGGIVSKNREAYYYLPDTVADFPNGEEFCKILRDAGFKKAEHHPMTFGIVTVYRASRN
jgi:demethylmenaquinone methyltransferase / 2-methoxy-6-polyprenyl-1,4-benzoquinol methylase